MTGRSISSSPGSIAYRAAAALNRPAIPLESGAVISAEVAPEVEGRRIRRTDEEGEICPKGWIFDRIGREIPGMLTGVVQGGKKPMRSLHRIGPVVLVLAVTVWLPSGSFAELAQWDQERVTALGAELSEACNALYDTFVKEPESIKGSGQSKDYYRLRQIIRRVKGEAKHLSSALAKGEGYDQTLPIYENLMTMVRDARETSQRIFTSNYVQDKAAAAGDVLRRLAPYYDPKALEEG
jgi:hypothetical protein